MKSTLKIGLILVSLLFLLVSCGTKNLTAPKGTDPVYETTIKSTASTPTVFPLIAGQTINAGTISIWNDAINIYVKYDLASGWTMDESHLNVSATLAGVPVNGPGNPVMGSFTYVTTHNPAVTTYTYTVPMATFSFSVGQTIIIVAHASVSGPDGNGGTQQQTGFGAGTPGPTGERWWFYMEYTITEDVPPPPPPTVWQYETAMARMNDVVNDFTYRWIMGNGKPHAWFSYLKWMPTEAPHTFYFYAGQSYKCGEVQIWKDGTNLKVQINMMNNWLMSGSHLNVQLTDYVGSPAFGLFPYPMSYNPITNAYTYSVPWNTTWDGKLLRIALHADVQKEIPQP
jgi:hypothetical protein